jgi:pyridoxal phosphate enzyme (YggS family)
VFQLENKPDEHQIMENLRLVRSDIESAAREYKREPEDITLIGVSKFFPPEYAAAAFRLGLSDLGENRVQELTLKIQKLAEQELKPKWHLIGTLQKNKVKYIIGKTNLIHSVDTFDLLTEISRQSDKAALVTDVLLQVNISGEASKHGFDPDFLLEHLKEYAGLPGIGYRGLMTMAPLNAKPDQTRLVFGAARELQKLIVSRCPELQEFNYLSMGMSQDFRQAIECGATHIRIGTAIFGSRQ